MSPQRALTVLLLSLLASNPCRAVINIACVGDSITYGVGVNNASIDSYPAKLQQLLGSTYSIQNDGLSGATLLKNGDTPYWYSGPYVNSHGRPPPNIVIIMLGTNDSKPQNWVYSTNFYTNYVELIGTYTNLPAFFTNLDSVRVLICTPPPVFNNGAFGINPGIEATNISPLIRQLGSDLGVQVIDLQALLAGHSEWFPDNVHPNSQGTEVMAAIVYTALQGDTMNGAVPRLGISRSTATNAVLSWPAGGAGWVLQSTPAVSGTAAWTVASQRAVTDETWLRITNGTTASSSMFRLWWPSN
jgi:acyl-CoA thioesterase-1